MLESAENPILVELRRGRLGGGSSLGKRQRQEEIERLRNKATLTRKNRWEISNWKSVLSGVPQESVLGPILFLIYINVLEDDISSKVLIFADDTKVFRKVTNDTDKQSLQDDLDKLVKWSEKWQMLLNFGKCKCLHIGHGRRRI